VNAINTAEINWDEVDRRRSYSMENDCNDELKLAAVMMQISKDPPEIHVSSKRAVNDTQRSQIKDTGSLGHSTDPRTAQVSEQ
jgi:hypothetical protein